MKEKQVYIDGDYLPYSVGFATQKTVYYVESEGEHTCSPLLVTSSKRTLNKFLKNSPDLLVTELFFVEDFIQALNTLKLMIQGIVTGSGCNTFKVVLTDEKSNYRDSIATIQPYKGNRVDSVKPVHWRALRDWLLTMPYTIVSVNEEADDVVSRAMMEGYVGASNDKDLNNTPGHHYNFNKKEKYYVTEEQAILNFYTQTLTGDTADHIPGIKGIGPVKAATTLKGTTTPEEMEQKVLEVYQDRLDLTSGEALQRLQEVGRLLWMRREEGEMWTPATGGEG